MAARPQSCGVWTPRLTEPGVLSADRLIPTPTRCRAGAHAWLPAASSCRSVTEPGPWSRRSALPPAAYGGVSCRSAKASPMAHTSTTTVTATSRATGPITRRTSIRTTSIRRTMRWSLRTTHGIPTRASMGVTHRNDRSAMCRIQSTTRASSRARRTTSRRSRATGTTTSCASAKITDR